MFSSSAQRRNFGESSTGITDVEASVSFIAKFILEYRDDHVPFHSCSLGEAIAEACFAPIQSRKIIVLYFHNEDDPFSKMFCPALVSGEVRKVLENRFYLLGWDVSDPLFHNALTKSLDENIDFDELAKYTIAEKCAALFIIYPVANSIAITSMLHGSTVKTKDVLTILQSIEKDFEKQIESETKLEKLENNFQSENDITSKGFQQLMFDRLGDRDYDCFQYNEHELLKQKIGYALFGPPSCEDGYKENQNISIDKTYEQIRNQNNLYSEWQDEVFVSFIYNCLEPMPEEKLARSRQYNDYNPNTDILPVPIYVIRKCRGSQNPCRIFVDGDNRVYTTWKDYLESNKLHKCTMVLPLGGRYTGGDNETVLLERHLSPSCSITHTILKGADFVSIFAGMASGGVFIAAMIPAITVAPLALTAAASTGAVVGIYSVFRSAVNIFDKYVHGENMSFADSEARGAYINIVAGTLGFVGAGATAAVSQLAASGVNIGQGARMTVTTINVMNISAGGVGVVNTTYQVVNDWVREQQRPSLLTIVQLSSSILFFGNAVYNFQTAGMIIEETQTNTLRDINDSMRSNRHRKTLNKVTKETIRLNNGDVQAGRAEVISTIRNIPNKDDVFAILTRNNKLFNKKGIRFAADKGEIKLNGIGVDLSKFGSMGKTQRTQFLMDLPPMPQPSAAQTKINVTKTLNTLQVVFEVDNVDGILKYGHLITSGSSFTKLAAELLQEFSGIIQEKILRIVKASTDELIGSIDLSQICKDYFPHISKEPFAVILQFTIDFLKIKMNIYEAEYETEKELAKQSSDFDEAEFNKKWKVHPDTGKRALFWFEKAVNAFVSGVTLNELFLREFIQYVMNTITERLYDYCEDEDRIVNRETNTERNGQKVACSICGGYYYHKENQ